MAYQPQYGMGGGYGGMAGGYDPSMGMGGGYDPSMAGGMDMSGGYGGMGGMTGMRRRSSMTWLLWVVAAVVVFFLIRSKVKKAPAEEKKEEAKDSKSGDGKVSTATIADQTKDAGTVKPSGGGAKDPYADCWSRKKFWDPKDSKCKEAKSCRGWIEAGKCVDIAKTRAVCAKKGQWFDDEWDECKGADKCKGTVKDGQCTKKDKFALPNWSETTLGFREM